MRLVGKVPLPGARTRSLLSSMLVREEASDAVSRNAFARRILVVSDLIAVWVALTLGVAVFGNDAVGPLTILAVPAIVIVCKLSGLYERDQYLISKTTLDEAPTLFWVSTLYTLLAFLAGDSFVNGHFGRDQAVMLWAVLFVCLIGFRYLGRQMVSSVTREERCVILGNASAAGWLVTKLDRSHRANVDVIGRVSLTAQDSEDEGIPRLGRFRELEEIVKKNHVDRVLIARGPSDPVHDALAAIRIAKRLGIYVTVVPRTVEVVGAAVEFDDVEGATLLGVKRHGLNRSSRVIKRAFDLVGATVMLAVASPAMVAIALAIKLDSRGPVFFRQRRMGRDDEAFRIYKFRTMVDGADAQREALAHRNEAGGGLFKIEDDPRITRVGKFLRRTSLDELPQLINVLKGDMSLVGPRPLVLDEDERIEGWERYRMMVPPGVTGMWQVLGSARIPMTEMVKIDYLYGANWSLWLDIKILLRTIPFVLARRGL